MPVLAVLFNDVVIVSTRDDTTFFDEGPVRGTFHFHNGNTFYRLGTAAASVGDADTCSATGVTTDNHFISRGKVITQYGTQGQQTVVTRVVARDG